MENNLLKHATDNFSQIIHPQLIQLINTHTTNTINTGDRVKDGAIILIINCLFGLLLKSVFHFLYILYRKCAIKQHNYEIDMFEVLKNTKKDDVEKYENFTIVQTYLLKYILKDCIDNKKIADYNATNNKQLEYYASNTYNPKCKNNVENSYILQADSHINVFVPLHKYYNMENEPEYIFVLNMRIYSKSGKELATFMKNMYSKYEEDFLHRQDDKEKYIYEITFLDTGEYSKQPLGKAKNIEFDNIHFDEKQILLEWLDKFKENKLYPKKLGICNKLGILLYGPPGTGKTGCISALANYLQRDIVNINTLDVDNLKSLNRCFNALKDTSIFVFDEIDYLLNSHEMTTTNTQQQQQTPENYSEMLLYAKDDAERKSILDIIRQNKKNKNKVIDTSFMIKLLDGIANDENRIIIATTNNPDKINKLLLRPGRFDLKLKLGFCSWTMFVNIVQTKYETMTETDFHNERQRITCILFKNITPLVLINHLVISKSFSDLLYSLEKLHQSQYEQKC